MDEDRSTKRRTARVLIAAALGMTAATAGYVVTAASAQPERGAESAELIQGKVVPPLPKLEGPIPVTATSHPWGAAAHGLTPIDLAKQGYVEEEYLVKGQANVYDEAEGGALSVLASGPYATRVLVRRPAAARRFSGNVVVELNNPTSNYDVDIMWAADHDYFMSHGNAHVGVSIKPVVFEALKTFDPQRYGALSMANPRPEETCEQGSAETENGLAWDMISQIGAVVRSSKGPLAGRRVRKVFLTGFSQTGGYMVTYLNEIVPHFVRANGKLIFDGHVLAAGYNYPWLAPINQCAAPAAPGTPGFVVQPAGDAPVIDVQTLSDSYAMLGWAGERPDADAPGDHYRLYQVPGSSHIWQGQVDYTPGPDDLARAGFPPNDWQNPCLYPLNPFPLEYVMNAAFANLERWVRKGIPAPRAPHIEAVGDGTPAATIVNDEHGNALGGVRTPYVDVPTATYHGVTPGPGTCMLFWGYAEPFSSSKLRTLYPSHEDYVARVREDVAWLRGERWLTKGDAAKIVDEAERAPVPDQHH